MLFLFKINPINTNASPTNTRGNAIQNKSWLLLSPYNINPIPMHWITNRPRMWKWDSNQERPRKKARNKGAGGAGFL